MKRLDLQVFVLGPFPEGFVPNPSTKDVYRDLVCSGDEILNTFVIEHAGVRLPAVLVRNTLGVLGSYVQGRSFFSWGHPGDPAAGALAIFGVYARLGGRIYHDDGAVLRPVSAMTARDAQGRIWSSKCL